MTAFLMLIAVFQPQKSLMANLEVQELLYEVNAETAAPESGYSYYYKKLKYEASLAYTKLNPYSAWWTKIEPFNIYLGALPLLNNGHLDQIIALGVTDVLSMVEDFEMEDGWFNKPVKPSDWEANGIVVKHIQAVDFLPLKAEEIQEGVEYLAQKIQEGHLVYVHCKAGRGRSATIVICYLMQYEGLTFEEAYRFVKEQRPHINLNDQQRQAILDYFPNDPSAQKEADEGTNVKGLIAENMYALFQNMNEISEDKLTILLKETLHYVIDGGSYSPNGYVPQALSTWVPNIEIQSTIERRNRYLLEFQGDQVAATDAAISRNNTLLRKLKIMSAGAVPYIGSPTSQSISLWHQLREISLIAALHGHDVHDEDVQAKILSCLLSGSALKVPSSAVDVLVRSIAKNILLKAGLNGAISGVIPSHLVFNFFTHNATKVSTYAKEMFAGENSIPVPLEDCIEWKN